MKVILLFEYSSVSVVEFSYLAKVTTVHNSHALNTTTKENP